MSDAAVLRKINERLTKAEAVLDRQQGLQPTHAETRQMAEMQAEHRQLFNDLELTVPEPRPNELPHRYRVRLLGRLQPFSQEFSDVPLHSVLVPLKANQPIADQILAEAKQLAADTTIGSFKKPGELRELHRTDQSGNVQVSYHGNPISWMQTFMAPVVTYVTGFGAGPGKPYHMK